MARNSGICIFFRCRCFLCLKCAFKSVLGCSEWSVTFFFVLDSYLLKMWELTNEVSSRSRSSSSDTERATHTEITQRFLLCIRSLCDGVFQSRELQQSDGRPVVFGAQSACSCSWVVQRSATWLQGQGNAMGKMTRKHVDPGQSLDWKHQFPECHTQSDPSCSYSTWIITEQIPLWAQSRTTVWRPLSVRTALLWGGQEVVFTSDGFLSVFWCQFLHLEPLRWTECGPDPHHHHPPSPTITPHQCRSSAMLLCL